MFDMLIHGAHIIDGTGADRFREMPDCAQDDGVRSHLQTALSLLWAFPM